ncbi:MAG TPA: PAS domain S-box protein [Chthonomonadaceae bacterium]|nr:PAS domain S-box protein [Chthonomonadaceae bacterium]
MRASDFPDNPHERETGFQANPPITAVYPGDMPLQEILERQHLDEALARDALLLQNVQDAVIVTDLDGIVRIWNEGAARLFGWTAEEMIGRPLSDRYPAFERDRINEMIRGLAAGAEWDGEFEDYRKDGSRVWIDAKVRRVLDSSGKPVALIGISRDITQRRVTEAALRESQARLQRAAYEASHRIKNQFQVLASMVDISLMDAGETVPAEELRRVGRQIRTLSAIHDILTYEKKQDAAVSEVSVRTLLDKILWMLQQTAGRNQIRYHVEDVVLPVQAGTALALITNELVANAIKHGNLETQVSFTLHENQGWLEVCDDGPGFPEDFDPNIAAHTGLELIDGITRYELNGQIRYENRPEGGARVTLSFPLTTT